MSFMPLEHFRRNDPEHIRKLNAVVDKLNALGPISGAGGILVNRSPGGERVASLDPAMFAYADKSVWALIGANLENDTPTQYRWLYAWTEQEKLTAGYGTWTTKVGGLSGTTTVNPARNFVEDMNTAGGSAPTVEGNGVDIDGTDFPAGFAVMPCPTGVIVKMFPVALPDGTIEYWFSYENGIDGTCAA